MTSSIPKPKKIITYPIGSEGNGAALFLFGEPNASNLIIMSAGYPDDQESFCPLADRLSKETSSLVGVTCLPGYDDRPPDRPYTSHNPDGYSFQEMTNSIREAVKILKKESTNKSAKIIGIFHDWGVAPGTMWTNQTLLEGDGSKEANAPDRIVLFDVLPGPHPDDKSKAPLVPKDSIREVVTTLSYRIVLASCYAIRRYVSKSLAKVVFGVSFGVLGALKLSPTLDIDAQVFEKRENPITLDRLIYMAYPYYKMFKSIICNRMAHDFYGFYLPRNLQQMPVLYLYGTEKRIMFHDKSAVALLEKEHKDGDDKSCNAIAVPNAGHWLYLQQPDVCFDYVANFVKDA